MSTVVEDQPEAVAVPRPVGKSRPWYRQAMHLIRRGHLYLGLFLFPWAVLYGVTAFLFNHPSAFSDQPTRQFSASSLSGTPLEHRLGPNEQADLLIQQLNKVKEPTTPFTRSGEAKYTREFAFANSKIDGKTVSVLIDMKHGTGTIRQTPDAPPKAEPKKAPFLSDAPVGPPRKGDRGERPGPSRGSAETFKIDYPLKQNLEVALPKVLQAHGFAAESVTVTSVPDVTFPLLAEGEVWTATYNPLTGQLTARGTATEPEKLEFSFRRFLLRLHTAHGYPSEQNARWFWAIIVDVMAFVMCFWGISGLLMWWQLKATRWPGLVTLVLSAIAACWLGLAMYQAMSG